MKEAKKHTNSSVYFFFLQEERHQTVRKENRAIHTPKEGRKETAKNGRKASVWVGKEKENPLLNMQWVLRHTIDSVTVPGSLGMHP